MTVVDQRFKKVEGRDSPGPLPSQPSKILSWDADHRVGDDATEHVGIGQLTGDLSRTALGEPISDGIAPIL